jgi:hypothetical protein
MRTLLCGAAVIMSKLGLGAPCLVATFASFRRRGAGCSAFFPNHHSHVLFSNRKVSVVMTSVRLNARINEGYLSGRTLE